MEKTLNNIIKDSVHFSSESNEWATPQDLFNKLNEKYMFTLDPCATKENAKCDNFYTKQDDGLLQDWRDEVVFMNPPYGREISKWIEKAYTESLNGDCIVVCLIPSRTDTKYWHDFIFPYASEIRFIKGRLKFGGHKNSAPFPSAIVIFREGNYIENTGMFTTQKIQIIGTYERKM